MDPFRTRVEMFTVKKKTSRGGGRFPQIFSELGFAFVDDDRDGTCPDCDRNSTCEVVPELTAEWNEME